MDPNIGTTKTGLTETVDKNLVGCKNVLKKSIKEKNPKAKVNK